MKKILTLILVSIMLTLTSMPSYALQTSNIGISVTEKTDGTLTVTPAVTLANGTADGGAAGSGTVVVGAYKDGVLLDVSLADVDVAAYTAGIYNDYTEVPANLSALTGLPSDVDEIKVFAWNKDSLAPIQKATSYNFVDGYPEIAETVAGWNGEAVTDTVRGDVLKVLFNKQQTNKKWGSTYTFNPYDYITRNGSGKYVVEFWAKPSVSGRKLLLGMLNPDNHLGMNGESGYGTITLLDSTVADKWVKVRKVIDFTKCTHVTGGSINWQSMYDFIQQDRYGKGNSWLHMSNAEGTSNAVSLPETDYILLDDFKMYRMEDSVTSERNLMTNPATWENIWQNISWTHNYNNAADLYAADAHRGMNSIKWTNDQIGVQHKSNAYTSMDMHVPDRVLQAGKSYKFSFWARLLDGPQCTTENHYRMLLMNKNIASNWTGSGVYDASGNRFIGSLIGNEWTKLEFNFTIPEDMTITANQYGNVVFTGLRMWDCGCGDCTYLLDDFSLVEVN